MPNATTLEGQTLSFGKEGSYSQDDEKAFILYLDRCSGQPTQIIRYI